MKLIMMCEVPSNAILAEDFLAYFDGFSIGSNDAVDNTNGTLAARAARASAISAAKL